MNIHLYLLLKFTDMRGRDLNEVDLVKLNAMELLVRTGFEGFYDDISWPKNVKSLLPRFHLL